MTMTKRESCMSWYHILKLYYIFFHSSFLDSTAFSNLLRNVTCCPDGIDSVRFTREQTYFGTFCSTDSFNDCLYREKTSVSPAKLSRKIVCITNDSKWQVNNIYGYKASPRRSDFFTLKNISDEATVYSIAW